LSRKVLNNKELIKVLLEIKNRVTDLESVVKKTYDNGVYRISCPPYDIIVLEHSDE